MKKQTLCYCNSRGRDKLIESPKIRTRLLLRQFGSDLKKSSIISVLISGLGFLAKVVLIESGRRPGEYTGDQPFFAHPGGLRIVIDIGESYVDMSIKPVGRSDRKKF